MLELGVRPHDTLAAPPSVELRPLEPDDWPAVAEIYWDGMRDGLATFETEVPRWEAWDAAHLRFARLIAHDEQTISGWAALSPVSQRQAYAGVAEVSVYVAANHRNAGVGRALLEVLITESEKNGIWMLQAMVFPENVVTIALHLRCRLSRGRPPRTDREPKR